MGCYEYDPETGIQLSELKTPEIYPNPVKSTLKIDMGTTYDKVELIMMDINGKVMFTKDYKKTKVIDVNMAALPNGVYIIRLSADSGTGTFRVIKQ